MRVDRSDLAVSTWQLRLLPAASYSSVRNASISQSIVLIPLSLEVIQGILGEICRGGDANGAGVGVILVQIMKVYAVADTALQPDSGQVCDHISGEFPLF